MPRQPFVASLLCLVLAGAVVSAQEPVTQDFELRATLTKADLAEPIPPEAAAIAVRHLTDALQLLRSGAPPLDEQKEDDSWTLDAELPKWGTMPTDAAKQTYLAEYRQAFLDKWTSLFAGECLRTKDGGIHIPSGFGFETCCFQPAGTTRGYYAAWSLASELLFSSIQAGATEYLEQPEPKGGAPIALFSSDLQKNRYHGRAIAFLYLYAATRDPANRNRELLQDPIREPEMAKAFVLCRLIQLLADAQGLPPADAGLKSEAILARWDAWLAASVIQHPDGSLALVRDVRLPRLEEKSIVERHAREEVDGLMRALWSKASDRTTTADGTDKRDPPGVRYTPDAAASALYYLHSTFTQSPAATENSTERSP